MPRRAVVEEEALSYPLGRSITDKLQKLNVPVQLLPRGARLSLPRAKTSAQGYEEAKNTLVVRVRKDRDFASCKPSAHYQLPLISSCPGMCQYCYLQTTLGPRPYIRVYANRDQILKTAGELMDRRKPEITVFEGAATSDPLPVEYLTGSLAAAIEFFGKSETGLFRFVTKFNDVEPILGLDHRRKTTVRFSLNADHVIRTYEHRTAGLEQRLEALARVKQDGYPVGVMIGPIITFEGWKEQYSRLMERIAAALDSGRTVGIPEDRSKTGEDMPFRTGQALPSHTGQARLSQTRQPDVVHFELITHRFTSRAKRNILSVFPNACLPMDESERRLVYGQFGYTKYLYPKETMEEIRAFFENAISRMPGGRLQYLV